MRQITRVMLYSLTVHLMLESMRITRDFSQENALSFKSLNLKYQEAPNISPSMSKLQVFYGLTPPRKASTTEGTEMTVHRTYNKGEQILDQLSPNSDHETPVLQLKSRSLGFSNQQENSELYQSLLVKEAKDSINIGKMKADNSVRRHKKADLLAPILPETILKDDSTVLAVKTSKGLYSLPKSGSRIEGKLARQNKNGMEETSMTNGYVSFKKSSSTTSLQESDGGLSSWSSSMWNLKSDSVTKLLFDGLPKPIIPWRSKML